MRINARLERRVLQFSALSALAFAAVGVGFGAWIGSLVIMFDGAYSLVSVALSLMAVAVSRYAHGPVAGGGDDRSDVAHQQNHTDRALIVHRLEQTVIVVKGVTIIVMSLVTVHAAVRSLFTGGRPVDAGGAVIYGVVNVVGCAVSYAVVRRYGRRAGSALVAAESSQWLMDTVISAAVLVGFFTARILEQTALAAWSPYADPVMVIIAAGYFLIVPTAMVRDALIDLTTGTRRAGGTLGARHHRVSRS